MNQPYSGYGNVFNCGPNGCFDDCAPSRFVGGNGCGNPGGNLEQQVRDLYFRVCQLQNFQQVPITVFASQSLTLLSSGLYGTTLQGYVNISTQFGNKLSLVSDGLYSAPATFSLAYTGGVLTVIIDGTSKSVSIASTSTSIPPVFFQIGDGGAFTPAQGTTTYTNASLPANIFSVEQRSVGTLVSDQTKSYADISISGKSFTFTSGYEFSDGDIFTIKFS